MSDPWEFDSSIVCMKNMSEKLELAETLSRVNLMTSPAVKKRLAARSLELKFGHLDEDSGVFVPPKQVLLYLVRMGSFNATPKILNDDAQDNDIQVPANISRQELIQLCQKQPLVEPMVKRAFRKLGKREKPLSVSDEAYDFKCKRITAVTKACSDYVSNPYTLRVFQWNILSQALGMMNDNFVKCPDEALEWPSRKYKIIEEIIEYCPDVICLQEVDHFNFLKTILATQGYSGAFFPKPDSPCVYIPGNNGPDGCAIFYRSDKFALINMETRILEIWRVQSNQVALLMNLRVKETNEEVSITTTHLKARQGALLSTLRNEQGRDLLNFVAAKSGGRPVVVCGDFNAEPVEPVYATVLSQLGSAYADCDTSLVASEKREPAYTTWKIRDEGEVCHTIDYIFYDRSRLGVEAVLEMPTGEEIGENRVPSLAYPSDHFSLVCDLRLGKSEACSL